MISIVIPAFNEEGNIPRIEGELIPVLNQLGRDYEVLVVDDGSIDETKNRVRELMKKYSCIRLCEHDRNYGLGRAIRTGINNAKGELLITLDADFTFHPREIFKLIDRFKEGDVDCIIGSHFSKEGKTQGIPFHRIFLSRCINLLYSIILCRNIKSVSSIFRLYKTDQLKKMHISSEDFDINVEILFKLISSKGKVVEVPVTLTTRIYGKSKLNTFREIKNHVKLLCKIIIWRFKSEFLR